MPVLLQLDGLKGIAMNGEDKIQDAINSLLDETSTLRRQLEEEREKNQKNQEEWDNFFRAAHLKNPITGEPITSREDFYNFKEQEKARRTQLQNSMERHCIEPQKGKKKVTSFSDYTPMLPMIAVIIAAVIFIFGYTLYQNGELSLSMQESSHNTSNTSSAYVGSVNSDFVHWKSCRYAQNINEENRVYYDSLSDAIADGRKRCSECLPASKGG